MTGRTTFSITIKHFLSWENYRLALATAQLGEPWETGSGLCPLLTESVTSLLHSQRHACHSIGSGSSYSSLCVKSVSSLRKEMKSYQTPRRGLKLATLRIQSKPVWTSNTERSSDLQRRHGISPGPVAISFPMVTVAPLCCQDWSASEASPSRVMNSPHLAHPPPPPPHSNLSWAGLFSLLVSRGEFYTFNLLLGSNYQGCHEWPWLCDPRAPSSRVVSEWHTQRPGFSLWACFWWFMSCVGPGLRSVFALQRWGK